MPFQCNHCHSYGHLLAHCHLPFLKNQLSSLPKSKSVWQIKKADTPVDFPVNFPATFPVKIPEECLVEFPDDCPVNLPTELDLSIDIREGIIPLIPVNCEKNCLSPMMSFIYVNSVEPIDEVICDSTLKPLSLISLVYFEEGNILSNYLEAGVEHMDNFILGESSLKDLGFSSPIKVSKGTGSGYFLRSSSKVLLNSVSSTGFRRLLTPTKLVESVKGFD